MASLTVTSALPRAQAEQTEIDDLGSKPFREAIWEFLETRKPFIRPKTYHEYKLNAKTLIASFGNLQVREITSAQIRRHQLKRLQTCGASAINHECSLLQQLLKRCGTWERVGLGYQPLPRSKEGPGRAISEEEEQRLLRAGASNPNWEAVYFCALISLNTTMGPGEVMALRRKDIDLDKEVITVNHEGAKNPNRIRLLPLNEIAVRTCRELLDVAEKKGAILPDHYVFPFRRRDNTLDPTRHCLSFKTAWLKLLNHAGIEKLRLYDLRHTAITRLCEKPDVSEEVIESIAGHVTHQMKKRYCHIRVEARRAALAGLVPERLDRAHTPGNGGNSGPQKTGKPLTNEHVLSMIEAGLPAKVIVAKIERAPGNFDTEPETLKALKQANVPDAVIHAMVRA